MTNEDGLSLSDLKTQRDFWLKKMKLTKDPRWEELHAQLLTIKGLFDELIYMLANSGVYCCHVRPNGFPFDNGLFVNSYEQCSDYNKNIMQLINICSTYCNAYNDPNAYIQAKKNFDYYDGEYNKLKNKISPPAPPINFKSYSTGGSMHGTAKGSVNLKY